MTTPRQLARQIIDEWEGGYSDHPDDPGGPTKYGISFVTLRLARGRATVADVQELTKDEAITIMVEQYYDRLFDDLPEPIRLHLFDASINHGPRRAVKLWQTALNREGRDLAVDGIFGPKTLAASRMAAEASVNAIANALVDQRIRLYVHLVAAEPSQLAFLNGWIERALSHRQ